MSEMDDLSSTVGPRIGKARQKECVKRGGDYPFGDRW